MFTHYDLDKDFGMDSPISLNGIDNSEQFCTFSAGETISKYSKNKKNIVPILKINLKSLLDKEDIKVESVNYKAIKNNENYSKQNYDGKKVTNPLSIIRQAKSIKNNSRKPLKDNNLNKVTSFSISKPRNHKGVSPFQRTIPVIHSFK